MSDESVLRIERHIESRREKTVKALRGAILSNRLKPGQRLVERDLCEQTGVSRSSIREALRHLESEGLVERAGAKSMTVMMLDRKLANDIYEVRAALEAEAAQHFAERATDAEIALLKQNWEAVDAASRTDLYAHGVAIDRFFETLFAGARNAAAEALSRTVRARISLMRGITNHVATSARIAVSVAQMKLIVDALERRDGAAAAEACRNYVARSAAFADRFFGTQRKTSETTAPSPVKRMAARKRS